ncbi:PH domain-containing protein [Microbacterium sp. NPDC003461]
MTIAGRVDTPPPGVPAPEELVVARFRRSGRRLFWSALLVVVVAGATGYLWGNLPEPFEDWMLAAAAAALVLLGAILPWIAWLSHRYTITTRRVIAARGLFSRSRAELTHARGYAVNTRRGPLQRLWGTGTLTLADGMEGKIVLADIPSPRLVAEVLTDQIEVNQILAHRDAVQTGSGPTA